AAPDLFDGDAVRQKVGPRTTILLGKRQAEQPELAHLANDVVRERRRAVHLFGARLDLFLGEIPAQAADHLLLVAEREIHRGSSSAGAQLGLGWHPAAGSAAAAARAPLPAPDSPDYSTSARLPRAAGRSGARRRVWRG